MTVFTQRCRLCHADESIEADNAAAADTLWRYGRDRLCQKCFRQLHGSDVFKHSAKHHALIIALELIKSELSDAHDDELSAAAAALRKMLRELRDTGMTSVEAYERKHA